MSEGSIVDGVIMLGAALAFVFLFRRLGLGAVLGYLVAGAVIGPQGLGWVGEAEQKLGIAELGIVLLLFLVGLELHPSRLWRLRRDIFGLGLAQVVVCGLALSAVIYTMTGFSLPAAIAIGMPLALSSTAQVLPMLRSAGRLNTPFGERSFSVLLFQDLSIVPLITIIAALSRAPADPSAPPGWMLAIYTVLAVAGLVAAGRWIINPLFRLIGGLGEREMFVAAGLFTVLASAALMEWLHLSTALGAFVAGVMLADSPYRHELEADVEPFRTILLGLFFLAVGMMLDLAAIAARPLFIVGLAVAVVAVKTLIIFLLARMFGIKGRQALGLGLLLSQGGEFGFVLFAQAANAQLIAPEAASLMGAVVTLSMATTPFLMILTRRFNEPKPAARDDLDGAEKSPPSSAIVVGYGRFGQTVAQMLMASGATVTIIDNKAEQIDIAARFDMKVYYGDGTRLDLLRQAGGDEARTIVFAMDGDQLSPEELTAALHSFRQAAIFVRAYDRRALLRYKGIDISATVREVYESAVKLGRLALGAIGLDEEQVDKIEQEYRLRDKARLRAQVEAGDIFAQPARDLMFRNDGRQEVE
ncbi:monovalent cation:proton antiporter-2 (CPA2) family protein [Sphingomonas naphthae]|uniref:Monovalent cation:proton antiporter-2 (CPA2) family protein n=1 Tax=Sphingomonas naphthae TaxID=1813468 RepID=A0ABY7TG80_9SPHN|nr:monovalent cation:proton antiporter-2 (CPA2) family protein [Sphingomonas naphthae]WCT71976.1 monovalent cation:proton antiporter-2 (CPA2) family protein [Sphingomonas naphthae]